MDPAGVLRVEVWVGDLVRGVDGVEDILRVILQEPDFRHLLPAPVVVRALACRQEDVTISPH